MSGVLEPLPCEVSRDTLKLARQRPCVLKNGNIYSVTYAGETFYTQAKMDEAYEQGHSDGYQAGGQDGCNDGHQHGYERGHGEGNTLGNEDGYHAGYEHGSADDTDMIVKSAIICDDNHVCGDFCNCDCQACVGATYALREVNGTQYNSGKTRANKADDEVYSEYST